MGDVNKRETGRVDLNRAVLLSCRSGFESDCASEIQHWAQILDVAGFVRTKPKQGYVLFECFIADEAMRLYQDIDFRQLVFARQWFLVTDSLTLDCRDRITGLKAVMPSSMRVSDIQQSWPDTNEGKQISRFAKKFTRPLQRAFAGHIVPDALWRWQLFWLDSGHVLTGYQLLSNSSPYPMGIVRLRQPKQAPSRSSLKLDEAFSVLLNESEREQYVRSGQWAVDLGACPGGWTYQLVQRNMYVAAVDNGPMADDLMESGQVMHYREDGFKFVPPRQNMSWLVCDMVEKPSRVARLMLKWLIQRWCRYAIFNLKLPMKKRYAEVVQKLAILRDGLAATGVPFELRAKHLYHDREEITVFACLHHPD